MKFRLQAFGLHLLASVTFMAIALGGLYAGWYRWPGWYLAGALTIALMMIGIDVVLGPLLTLVIANPRKPRRELARDVGIIVAVQLVAAGYGLTTLWHGRPLYYTYSERFLQMVQASDLDPQLIKVGQQLNPALAPHWYSLPRWMYAPLPVDEKLKEQIVKAAVAGGNDVIQMPQYYRPWDEGLPEVRRNLRVVRNMTELTKDQKDRAEARMRALGVAADQPIALPMLGRGKPLVAVIDPATARIQALIRVD